MSDEWVEIEGLTAVITPGALWDPVGGEETESYLGSVIPEARSRLRNEARVILSRSMPPVGHANSRAGLIVGHVQSGKTASMAACAAMGRDNRIGLVVLIAGTSRILLAQSRRRFEEALRLGNADAYRRWEHFESPRSGSSDADHIAAALDAWLFSRDDEDRPTVLITVMKQTTHLRELADVLREVSHICGLGQVPALVFDDEADQASPNLRRAPGAESATYRDLRNIRAELPWHTFLQYTATPQALLLLDIADEISPEFTCVLRPGPDYVGGHELFMDRKTDFVRIIPGADLAAAGGSATEPPDSFLKALAVFVVGAVANRISDRNVTQRSMLVHPSLETLPHANFAEWTRAILRLWQQVLELPEDDPDRQDLLEGQLLDAYTDLAGTVEGIVELPEIAARLPGLLARLRVEEVNARGSEVPEIDWSRAFAWILIGGTLMDRGFTVEGLTVTYMPRGPGVGNADTLQQRGRFFGYKRAYVGYCRAWLEADVATAFEAYVEHEESVRSELIIQTEKGMSLRQWRRHFILDPGLQPTRRAVIRLPYDRPQLRGWLIQDHLSAPNSHLNDENRRVVDDFLGSIQLDPEPGLDPRRTAAQRHLVATIPLADVHRQLIAPYAFYEGNATDFMALQLLTGSLEEDTAEAVIFLMSSGASRRRSLEPGTTRVENLMQGRNPTRGPAIYPGDREIHDDSRLTIQVHFVDVTETDGTVVQSRVPALAVWIPDELAKGMLIER